MKEIMSLRSASKRCGYQLRNSPSKVIRSKREGSCGKSRQDYSIDLGLVDKGNHRRKLKHVRRLMRVVPCSHPNYPYEWEIKNEYTA